MEALAAIVRSHPRMLVVSDEVYKYTIYDSHSEVRNLAVPCHSVPALGAAFH